MADKSVVINAMDGETLLIFLKKNDPLFQCFFCEVIIPRISKIGGIKQTKEGPKLICTATDCGMKTWNKATHLE